MTFLKNLLSNKSGATAIEYGLIAALIAITAVTAMGSMGTQLSTTLDTFATKMAG